MAKPVKAVFFDLDGTLVRYRGVDYESSWGALGVAAGLGEEWDKLLRKYLGKPDLYGEWARENAALLRGLTLEQVAPRLFPPPYAPGAPEAVAVLRERGLVLGIVSSGISLVADRVREELELDFAIANELVNRDGVFTGEVILRVDLWGKLEVVRREAAKRGLTLDEVAFVGDHLNDLPVLRAVGWGVAYAPKDPQLERAARFVIRDFRELPKILREHI